jgi:hypothetical protein
MPNAFISNFDSASVTYDWLKTPNLSYSFTGVKNSVLQEIESYAYVSETFKVSTANLNELVLKDYSRVSG